MRRLVVIAIAASQFAWTVRGPGDRPTRHVVEAGDVFAECDVDGTSYQMASDPGDLGRIAGDTLAWIRRARESGQPVPVGMLPELGVDADRIERTLEFVRDVAIADRGAPRQRLSDPAFVEANFEWLRWSPDTGAAARAGVSLAEDQIRLTRYLVYRFDGSPVETPVFDTALYSVPHDDPARGDAPESWRMRLTRREVLDGAFEPGGVAAGQATPLVWLRRADVHEALLQGTVEVVLPGGGHQTFNVHKNNGRAYVRGQLDHEQQDRFWYFREVNGVGGWGGDPATKIQLRPLVSVAGDAYNLGLGALFALGGDDGSLRLAVMADTGGAFQPNLYQLDLFAGTYPNRAAFEAATGHVPARVDAWILVLRDDA
jgi:hypothetical protein